MLCVLKNKFIRLGRDEDGVALVTTLTVFMFMYLVCIGVYAMGTAVKTRTHLQNACDAAAYSAAVVQADTLSRIATINRAMSWTYVQMTRRQMDYIVDNWLKHTLEHFNQDKTAALLWYLSSMPPPPCPIHASWGMGSSPDDLHLFGSGAEIDLNGTRTVPPSAIQTRIDGFKSYVPSQRTSFYVTAATVGSLGRQIDADKETIAQMNRKLRDLADGIPQRVKDAVANVLQSSLDNQGDYASLEWRIFQNESPRKDSENEYHGDGYLRDLHNRGDDEERFLEFSRLDKVENVFSTGIDDWFERADRSHLTFGNTGLQRAYRMFIAKPDGKLVSRWAWWSTKSIGCEFIPDVGYVHGSSQMLTVCPHLGIDDRCRHARTDYLLSPRYIFQAEFHGNGMCVWNDRYEGEKARPFILRRSYFGKSGAITVALAVRNQNPWAPILGTAIRGIFSAFNIGVHLPWTPQYTVCFASAKAGYKNTLNWANSERIENDRGYRVDWQNERAWNLCQSDWDAVLIPVRRGGGESLAEGGVWSGNVGNFLDSYARSLVDAGQMRAGGDGLDVAAVYNGRDLGEEYRFGNQAGFWGGMNPPRHPEPNGVRAKWRIGKPNQRIDWGGLQKVMFH